MTSKTRILLTSSLLALVLVAMIAAPASAVVVLAGPGGVQAGYATPVSVAPVGGPLTFVNGDIAPHNVIAYEDFLPKNAAKKTPWCKNYTATKCPIFWSKTVALGGSASVEGLENTEAGGQYRFFCSIHPGMKGTLITV